MILLFRSREFPRPHLLLSSFPQDVSLEVKGVAELLAWNNVIPNAHSGHVYMYMTSGINA